MSSQDGADPVSAISWRCVERFSPGTARNDGSTLLSNGLTVTRLSFPPPEAETESQAPPLGGIDSRP